jgi:acetyl esterase/lipase
VVRRDHLSVWLADYLPGGACPTLVCHADADPIASQARQLFDALACSKTYCDFTSAEGAGDHCEAGARALFNQRVFDWLDDTIGHTVKPTVQA